MSDSEEAAGAGANDPGSSTILLPVDRMVNHLHKIVSAVLEDDSNIGGGSGSSDEGLRAMFTENADLLSKFIGDNHSKSLLIERFSGKEANLVAVEKVGDAAETSPEETEELDQVRLVTNTPRIDF